MDFRSARQLVRTDLQVHLFSDALLRNIAALRGCCQNSTKLCAVVKANAYGHGVEEVVGILKAAPVDFFGVANIFEAIHISELIGSQSILILEPIYSAWQSSYIKICAEKGFHCVLGTDEAFEMVSDALAESSAVLNVHVKVETGMGRCGTDPNSAALLIERIDKSKCCRLGGVYTHFATADDDEPAFVYEQIERFKNFLSQNSLDNRDDIIRHSANSAATIKIADSHFDMVRCGIGLYGYYTNPDEKRPVKLDGVLKLEATIVQLKKINKGQTAGYGRTFTAERDTVAAVVPIGYGSGYQRIFSNKAKMKLAEHTVPVIGRVSMDKLLIDVTDVPGAREGQMVTIIDNDASSACSVYELARLAETISYEILTAVGANFERIVH